MGCDTHMYIEYRKKDSEQREWNHFGGRINPGINYFIFGIISEGVRCDTTFTFPPKGMPDDAGYKSRNDNQLYISENDGEGYVSLEKAKGWVNRGGCKFIKDPDGNPTWVTHPDWHSHSWLSVSEFEQAMQFYREHENGDKYPEPEYEVLLSALQRFEQLGFDSRVVFWFDN